MRCQTVLISRQAFRIPEFAGREGFWVFIVLGAVKSFCDAGELAIVRPMTLMTD